MEILPFKMLIAISRKFEDFVRKIGLVIIDIVLNVLWFVDRATSFTFRQVASFSKKLAVVFFSTGG